MSEFLETAREVWQDSIDFAREDYYLQPENVHKRNMHRTVFVACTGALALGLKMTGHDKAAKYLTVYTGSMLATMAAEQVMSNKLHNYEG